MSGNARTAISAVAIVGDGLVAHFAALALRRALPRADVMLVPSVPDADGAIDTAEGLPVLFPTARVVAEAIGLDLERLAAAGLANHRLADRFAAGRAPAWLRGFGEPAGAVGPGAFHQTWLEARRRGTAQPYHAYLPAAALAEAGRHALPGPGAPPLLSRADAAIRLAPDAVRAALARQCTPAHIATAPAPLAHAMRTEGGGVAAVQLADGSALSADLFVDCTGPAARLADDAWEGWDLGADRLLIADADPATTVLVDAYGATAIGWQGTVPLPDGGIAWGAWQADATGEGRARKLFGMGARGRAVPLRTGRRADAFCGNVVALGGAAAEPGPMMATGLSLALAGLDLLVELLPGSTVDPGERREYNRRFAALAARARDFAALPNHLMRGQVVKSPALASALAQFRARGTLIRPEEDLFDPGDWIGIMLGAGIVPDRPDPVAMGADPAKVDAGLDRLARAVATLPAQVPLYRGNGR